MSDGANIKWNDFEIRGKLNEDSEYRALAQFNYDFICQKAVGFNCTRYTGEFLMQFQSSLKNYRVGAVRIGPSTDGHSYTHEAVGIAKKNANEIVAIFDPIRNAAGGQKNASCSSANDRYSLTGWLNYKSRWYRYIASDNYKPFSVFLTKEVRNLPRQPDYSWVLHHALSIDAETAKRSVMDSGPKY